MKLKLRSIGSSIGVILPKRVLKRLKVSKNDSLLAIETPDGYLLTPFNAHVAEQVRLGRKFMEQHRDIFAALAD